MVPLKRAMLTVLTLASLSGCGSQTKVSEQRSSSQASQAPKAYQATYSAPGNFAYQTEHFVSDGRGHVRLDISGTQPAATVVTVLDLGTNEITMWTLEDNKFVRRQGSPMDPIVMRVGLMNVSNKERDADGESLGAKNIYGHNCHGWRKSGTTIWFDDDYGCPVETSAGGVSSSLSAFSTQAPDPSVFSPPAGYIAAQKREPMQQRLRRSVRSDALRDTMLHMH
jgi:hypothetical protein